MKQTKNIKPVRYDAAPKQRRTKTAKENQESYLIDVPTRSPMTDKPDHSKYEAPAPHEHTHYVRARHAAVRTTSFIFNQLIPYIGNKRKLLPLIQQALLQTGAVTGGFVDLFAGSGVVSRLAKQFGYRVICNDWEHDAHAINRCYIACNEPPPFRALGGYDKALAILSAPPLYPRKMIWNISPWLWTKLRTLSLALNCSSGH